MTAPDIEIVEPLIGKVSPVTCLGGRTPRATCPCCGGSDGVRRAKRKRNWKIDPAKTGGVRVSRGAKPRYKDHK